MSQAVVCTSETLNAPRIGAQTIARAMPLFAASCGLVLEVDRGGIEPPTPGLSVGLSKPSPSHVTSGTMTSCETADNQMPCGAQQKAQHSRKILGLDDPRLARLIEVWPMLSEGVKAAIKRLTGDDVDDLNDVAAKPDGEAVS